MNFKHISEAHQESGEKMMNGLAKISQIIMKSAKEDNTLVCGDFEKMIKMLYSITTENQIDVKLIDYEWTLAKAKIELQSYVANTNLSQMGLTYEVISHVCPRIEQ